MSRIAWQGLALAVVSLALPVAAGAQDAASVLQPAAEALRIGRIDGLRLIASGSGYEARAEGDQPPARTQATASTGRPSPEQPARADERPAQAESQGSAEAADTSSPIYVPPPPPRERQPFRIVSQIQTLDLAAESLRIEQVRAESTSPGAEQQRTAPITIDAGSDWAERHRYWLTPHAFVSGALARDASVGKETIDGVEYRVVTFAVDGHEVRGYVDSEDRLVRIRTTADAADGEGIDVIESFFDWVEQGDLTFPSVLIRKENGVLAEVLVVQEVDAPTSG